VGQAADLRVPMPLLVRTGVSGKSVAAVIVKGGRATLVCSAGEPIKPRPARSVSVLTLRAKNSVRAGNCWCLCWRTAQLFHGKSTARQRGLHIGYAAGGALPLQCSQELRLETSSVSSLPLDSSLRVADMPAIFLVSGTGFSPIKSIIEDALKRGIGRPMRLYRGGRSQDDFYMLGCFAAWGRHSIPSYLCFHKPAIRGKGGPAFAWCYKRTVI
jgi:hypothetical protein